MAKHTVQLSPAFKAQTTKAIIAIGVFILTYLLILVLAVILTVLCVYGGIALIMTAPRIITIGLGIGLSSLGIFVLIFLLKFMFKSHKIDRSHLQEISRAQEPALFKMIDDIVEKVGTSAPKKVYLSADVNAAVFYDSNFWSMFLPIRKNLQIGLGLVNTVTQDELKAILAHEFGHFAQKTMKVGSYVYNVNQVIFNMLYDNEGYEQLVERWANSSGYIAIFAALAFKIVQGIQWVLRQLYAIVNKSYMGLSREMEFHADEIAASVTGYEPLKSSLLRMDLADDSFSQVLNFYTKKVEDSEKSTNLYPEQLFVMNFLAADHELPIKENLPVVTSEDVGKFNKSKLVIENQWASHPSTEQRIARLEQTNLKAEQITYTPANKVFSDIAERQAAFTNRIFQEVSYPAEATAISLTSFQAAYQEQVESNTFSKIYNGYYDQRNPVYTAEHASYTAIEQLDRADLFSDEKVDWVHTAVALHNDISTIYQIAENAIPVKTFDYDGKKYNRKESEKLITQLTQELEQILNRLKQNDIQVFRFFQACEQGQQKDNRLEQLYQSFQAFDTYFDEKHAIYTQLAEALQFVSVTTPIEQIRANFAQIATLEKTFKSNIQELLADDAYQSTMTQAMRDNFELYGSQDWEYFGNESYLERNLGLFTTALDDYVFLLSRGYFLLKKQLLDYQEQLWVQSSANAS